ncbi:nucleotidyltransferase family protein [endosymbiont GvMRE of Glomus versiforme]|uniref:nucleotidyltransferase family protein n=1 Tax=endosymbiont GvMRE of Glomus versiforme TaxID=2039283 RepID=UPI000EEEFF41|nr:nucleotidyltransferase domain-containing protein [endosymbiont GvMRE of Glomus versiforme]RHZ36052.1 DNA polymerase beta domain protein region [endosymbiont GvMRE of Glomus versiforme]
MLQLETRHQKIIQQILAKYPYHFYAYGSRTKGTARKLSDLDLCYQEEIPDAVTFLLEEEFKESDLPFNVELVSWKNMKPSFRELIKEDLTKLD